MTVKGQPRAGLKALGSVVSLVIEQFYSGLEVFGGQNDHMWSTIYHHHFCVAVPLPTMIEEMAQVHWLLCYINAECFLLLFEIIQIASNRVWIHVLTGFCSFNPNKFTPVFYNTFPSPKIISGTLHYCPPPDPCLKNSQPLAPLDIQTGCTVLAAFSSAASCVLSYSNSSWLKKKKTLKQKKTNQSHICQSFEL